MVPQNRIKLRLREFLDTKETTDLLDNVEWKSDGDFQLGDTVTLRIKQGRKEKISFTLSTNTKNGFSEYRKETTL